MWGGNQGGYNQGGYNQGGFGGGMQGGYGQGGYGGGMQGGYGGMQGGYGMNIQPNTPYKILSAYNRNFCIDSSQGILDRGQLILYNFHGGHNQLFRFLPGNIPGSYYIINFKEGAIEPPDDWQRPGKQCWCDTDRGQDTQCWKVQPGYGQAQGRGFHLIMADGPGFCLDVEGQRFEDGTSIITWPCEGKANQTWIIEPHY